MTSSVRLAVSLLLRAPGRSLIRVLVLAASVALLGGMLLFVGNSLRTVAGSAVRGVPLDLQGPVSSYDQARAVASEVARQSGVLQASPAATAPLSGAEHQGPNGLTSSGAGAVLAVPLDYGSHIHTFRLLQGALRPGAVVLDQQMAATLQSHIGDRVTLNAGGPPRAYPVSGVGLVTAPDQLFQPLNPQLGPAPAQPPANVAIMPLHTFASTLARVIPTISALAGSANAQPGAQTGVQWQVQTQLDPVALSEGSPSAALERATQTRNRIERTLPGRVLFIDNLSDSLNTAAGDALYAETLYIMLAVPGALIALGLAYLAALGTVERDRRDLALLRARGARRRDLLVLAGIESLILGLVAGLLGTAAALGAVSMLVTGGAHASTGRVLSIGAICVLLATAGAGAARVGASLSALRTSVATGRQGTRREGKPLWQRLYLDIACLAVSGLIYWLTASTGFSAVVNPDSNPTLSLSVYMFFAPALLWVGATLLLVRLRGRALSWVIARAVRGRGIASRPRLFLLVSAGRRGAAINRGLVVVGLLLAFGVNLGIFSATYNQQVKVDAQLTLGADVTATAPPGVASQRNLPRQIAAVPGVAATTGVEHSYAYVGPDLQDTYGIDASSFGKATSLRDSYFIGSTAQQVLGRLRTRSDGIVVSKETITDFSLKNGDLLRLRVLNQQTGQFQIVPFHVAGIVQEFPSAPKDSFMVANLSYLESVTHAGGPNVVFAKVDGYPPDVARRVAAATGSLGTKVDNITDQGARTSSSITTVDLTGISHIEQAFAIVLAAAAMALFVALGISERRQEFATMAAIGAPLSRISAFLWTEAAIVLSVGLVLAVGLGWLLSEMLVAILQHVFDPPPDALAVPWSFLAGLAGAAILATLLATAFASRGIRRLHLGEILREQ